MPRLAAGRRALLGNFAALYGLHFGNYLLPLALTPFLARVLGVDGWGLFVFAQAFGNYLSIVVEYGFTTAGAREVARHRDQPARLRQLVADALGAKILLTAAALLTAVAAGALVPAFRDSPALLWAAVFWAIAFGFTPSWYFQGLERMSLMASIDLAAKALGTLAVFVFVRKPDQAWLALALQGAGATTAALIGLGLAYREVGFRRPTLAGGIETLRLGFSLFAFRGATSLYSVSNAFVLGLYFATSPAVVGYFGGADKIARAFQGLLAPLSQALFPRLSSQLVRDPEGGRRTFVRSTRLSVLVGLALTVVCLAGAPLWVRLLLGPDFGPSVGLVRVLSLLPLMVSINMCLGFFWLLPLGRDREFLFVIGAAGAAHLAVLLLVAPRFGVMGVAMAAVGVEFLILAGLYAAYRRPVLPPAGSEQAADPIEPARRRGGAPASEGGEA